MLQVQTLEEAIKELLKSPQRTSGTDWKVKNNKMHNNNKNYTVKDSKIF